MINREILTLASEKTKTGFHIVMWAEFKKLKHSDRKLRSALKELTDSGQLIKISRGAWRITL